MRQLINIVKIFGIGSVLFLFTNSCSDKLTIREIYTDGEYDTQFPSEEASQFISEISRSIKLINSLAFYKQYRFKYSENIRIESIADPSILSKSFAASNFNKSSSGTATVVGLANNNILFLTNAHIVYFPDTLYTYYADENGEQSGRIESISIKESQTNYPAAVGINNLEIVLIDNKKDIAFVGGTIDNSYRNNLSVFSYTIGDSRELEWGDFVYVFGYPMHYKMLTRGIVSIPDDDENYFMVDVNVNRGSSGGIVLALRDGVPNFELVGIISWVPAERKNVLAPKALYNDKRYQVDAKYEGEMFISEIENVKYGIARVVSIQSVKSLLKENYETVLTEDYDLSAFKTILELD